MRKILMIITILAIMTTGCNELTAPDTGAEQQDGAKATAANEERQAVAQNAELLSYIEPPPLDEIPISRALVAKMLTLTMLSDGEIEELPQKISFSDVALNDWHYKYINAAVSLKYMFGTEAGFQPDSPLTIYEAQAVIDRVNPDNRTKIKITEETRDLAISYALWTNLYKSAITELSGEKTPQQKFGLSDMKLIVLATSENANIPQWSMVTDKGAYFFKGMSMDEFLDREIFVYAKNGEIIFIDEIMDSEPIIENAYVMKGPEGYVDVFAGGAKRRYRLSGESGINSEIADVKISGKSAEITNTPSGIKEGAVKRVTDEYIELPDGKTDCGDFPVYVLKDGEPIYKRSKLIPGSEGVLFYLKEGKICAAVLGKEPSIDKIRVLISSTDYRMTVHTSVKLTADEDFTVSTSEGQKKFKRGELLTIDKDNNAGLFSSERIYVTADNGGKLELQSVLRGVSPPKCRGTLEISKEGEAFILINELSLQEYLYAVVSSQMPETLGLTASMAQAVASRSGAYNQFYLNRFAYYGANVDDSSKSQIYNAAAETETSIKAVDSTEAQMLTYEGEIIKPTFFLASSGNMANRGETWQKAGGSQFPSDTPEYLKASKQYAGGDYGDLSVEENALSFFKNAGIEALEKNVSWFRWSVRMDKSAIEASINANIKERYNANPSQVLTLTADGYERRPVESIGQLISMEVAKRGEGGNIMEMKVLGTNGEYLFKTENNIRMLIRPYQYDNSRPPIILARADGTKLENYQSMPSGFFAYETETDENGAIEAVNFYGGGNGHGVGMSQWGAKAMADGGASYEDILKHYYSGCEITEIG